MKKKNAIKILHRCTQLLAASYASSSTVPQVDSRRDNLRADVEDLSEVVGGDFKSMTHKLAKARLREIGRDHNAILSAVGHQPDPNEAHELGGSQENLNPNLVGVRTTS